MPLTDHWTADRVRELPDDGFRYETVGGELLVTPAPAPLHQSVLDRLHRALDHYLALGGIEGPSTSPADISWGDDSLVQPDLFVADLGEAVRTGRWSDRKGLELVVEILSPSTARHDRTVKRRLYQAHVPTYWIVSPTDRCVEIWTPNATEPIIERHTLRWRHSAIATECVIDLHAIFKF